MTNSTAALERGWYVVHTQSGFEDRVYKHLLQKIETEKLQEKIFSVMIPTEDVVEVTVAVVVASYGRLTPGAKAPNDAGAPSVSARVAGTVPPTLPSCDAPTWKLRDTSGARK